MVLFPQLLIKCPSVVGEFNAQLPERFRKVGKAPETGTFSQKIGNAGGNLNLEVRKYIYDAENQKSRTTDAWKSEPDVPTSEEILSLDENDIDLPPNRIRGAWKSSEAYLETHYRLLREDTASSLRDAVAEFRQGPAMSDNERVIIYENVHIVGFTFAPQGLAARLRFSLSRAKKSIIWEYSKRLVTGSMLALSPADDCFRTTCIVVVVAARPLEGVKMNPPEVDVFFANSNDIEIDPQKEFVMVEARTGYLEATRHTLGALQKLSNESFPFSDTLCKLKQDIEAPLSLQENPKRDISAAWRSNDEKRTEIRDLDLLNKWPDLPEKSSLDKSQWDALQQILTKRLAIIQGPPGTGKTHVSVVALKVLLENKRPNDPPIIVAAQTNHALDQLLRHLSVFLGEDYIRIGGRSSDLDIKKQSIFEVRQRTKTPPVMGGLLVFSSKQQRRLTLEMMETLATLSQEASQNPLSPEILHELGIIGGYQKDTLISGAAEWVVAGEEADTGHSMKLWLSRYLKSFEVSYKSTNFGFEEEEVDLEFEQLRELKAEQGVDEDEFADTLRGQFRPIVDSFTASPSQVVSKDEADRLLKTTTNMWSIPQGSRGAVYLRMQELAKAKIRDKFRQQARQYERVSRDLKIGKFERDAAILQSTKVIGLTMTGLSKYRALMSSLKPKIVLVEEAAEVIEAPVTVACMESVEHLILVGDHQQLQGHCNDQVLGDNPFYLNVSMFERLVENQIPYKTLTRQRRMDPEIRRLLQPIYGQKLEDHPNVFGRPTIPGMGNIRSFFFSHTWPESTDTLLSKYNDHEADFLAGFFNYLYQNGVPAAGITVLTFYNGQRKRILKALRQNPNLAGTYLNVATVDSYQGEENAVVLLSLVRSNDYADEKSIGFLAVANRVCVSLSRAKLGFFLFGNEQHLSHSSTLWSAIVRIMRSNPNRVGKKLPLQCIKHERTTYVSEPFQWQQLFGGCDLKCPRVMECGHPCPVKCHTFSHSIVRCRERCTKKLPCGHTCEKPCFESPCSCGCPDFARIMDEQPSVRASKPNGNDAASSSRSSEPKKGHHELLNGKARQYPTERGYAEAAKKVAIQGEKAKMDRGVRHNYGLTVDGVYGVQADGWIQTNSSPQSIEDQAKRALDWSAFAAKPRVDAIEHQEAIDRDMERRMAAARGKATDQLIDLDEDIAMEETVRAVPTEGDGPSRMRYQHTYQLSPERVPAPSSAAQFTNLMD